MRLFAAFLCCLMMSQAYAGCYASAEAKKQAKDELYHVKKKYTGFGAKPTPVKPLDKLPKSLNWCDMGGTNYCTPSWNQHIPQYCGSCYVHGSLAQVNDRVNIVKGAKGPAVLLARQVILNCGPEFHLGAGCNGGEPSDIFEFMHRYGLPSETCQNYVAKSSGKCEDVDICHNCMPVGDDKNMVYRCWAVHNYTRYFVTEYGRISGEAAIMAEVQARGPVTCGLASTDDFDYNYKGGVYQDTTNATEMNHDVEIVGWGETSAGVKYWVARNSWGTYWGEDGFFKIVRGVNNMAVEEECFFAVVDASDEQRLTRGQLTGGMYGRRPKPVAKQVEDSNVLADAKQRDQLTALPELPAEAPVQRHVEKWQKRGEYQIPPDDLQESLSPRKHKVPPHHKRQQSTDSEDEDALENVLNTNQQIEVNRVDSEAEDSDDDDDSETAASAPAPAPVPIHWVVDGDKEQSEGQGPSKGPSIHWLVPPKSSSEHDKLQEIIDKVLGGEHNKQQKSKDKTSKPHKKHGKDEKEDEDEQDDRAPLPDEQKHNPPADVANQSQADAATGVMNANALNTLPLPESAGGAGIVLIAAVMLGVVGAGAFYVKRRSNAQSGYELLV